MGLLDSLLGSSIDDPKTLGLLQLASSLSSGQKFMPALADGLLGRSQILSSAERQKAAQQMQQLQMQQQQMALAQGQRQTQRQNAMEALPDQFMGRAMKPETMDNRDVGQQGEQRMQPGQFDMAGYANAMFKYDPKEALALQQYLRKDTTPVKLGAGDGLFDPITGKNIIMNPKEEKTPEVIRAIESVYGANSPQAVQAKQAYIQKMTTHQPGVNVNYGAPVAGVDAQGNPVFFQPDKKGGKPAIIPGVAPPKKDLPASMQEKFATNAVTLEKINKAIGLVSENPQSLGLKNYLGDTVMQRIDPQGVELRAMVSDIGGQKIHDRSGAAVTVGESQRLKPYIPAATDSPETVTRKLVLFRNEYAAMQQALNSGASIAQASAPQSSGGWSIRPAGAN